MHWSYLDWYVLPLSYQRELIGLIREEVAAQRRASIRAPRRRR